MAGGRLCCGSVLITMGILTVGLICTLLTDNKTIIIAVFLSSMPVCCGFVACIDWMWYNAFRDSNDPSYEFAILE